LLVREHRAEELEQRWPALPPELRAVFGASPIRPTLAPAGG